MKIEFDFDIDDWEAFQWYYFANSPTYRRRKRVMLFLYLFISTFTCCVSLQGTMLFIVLPIILVFWVIFMRQFYEKLLIWRSKKRLLKTKEEQTLLGKMEMDFNHDGFWLKTPITNNFITWNELEYLDENDAYFFLHKNENEVCIIPKQKVTSKLEELYKFFEENVVVQDKDTVFSEEETK